MFKFVVVSVLVFVASSAPAPGVISSASPAAVTLGAPLFAHSTVIGSVPTSITSSSSSVLHSAAIVPAIQTLGGPLVGSLAAEPAVATVGASAVATAPVLAGHTLLAPGIAAHGFGAPVLSTVSRPIATLPGISALSAHGIINGAALGLNGIHGVHAALL